MYFSICTIWALYLCNGLIMLTKYMTILSITVKFLLYFLKMIVDSWLSLSKLLRECWFVPVEYNKKKLGFLFSYKKNNLFFILLLLYFLYFTSFLSFPLLPFPLTRIFFMELFLPVINNISHMLCCLAVSDYFWRQKL